MITYSERRFGLNLPVIFGCNHLIQCFKKSIKLGDTIELATQRESSLEKTEYMFKKLEWTITGIFPTMIECTRITKAGASLKEYFLYHEVLEQKGRVNEK